jgi:hypothetical protein
MKDAQQAFEEAIAAGRLSLNPAAVNYVGHYMYMGPNAAGTLDTFKHRLTRQYIA